MRDFVLAEIGAEPDAAQRRHAAYYLAASRVADDFFEQGGDGVLTGLSQCADVWPHLCAAWEWMRAQPDAEARH